MENGRGIYSMWYPESTRLMVILLRSGIKYLGLNDIDLQKRIFEGHTGYSSTIMNHNCGGCQKGVGLEVNSLLGTLRYLSKFPQ